MNLKTNVIAAEVENLTDARYFAAWGVNILSFNLQNEQLDTASIKEIIDWVEGPQYFGHLTQAIDTDIAKQKFDTLGLDGIIASPFSNTDQLTDWSAKVYREVLFDDTLVNCSEELLILKLEHNFQLEDHIEALASIAQQNELYIEGIYETAKLSLLLDKVNPKGIVVKGGEEEKVGFKSYDALDEVFEYLEEL